MWFSRRGQRRDPTPPREPRLADAAAFARCFAQWSETAHREMVRTYQVGHLLPSDRRRPDAWQPSLPLPMLQLVVPPGESIDFADPRLGFAGMQIPPPGDRVLSLWADDLLSVSHGTDWMFVLEARQPFPRAWLDLLVPPLGVTYGYWDAVVAATFAGPTPARRMHVRDLDATTYTTRVHIEDRRVGGPRPDAAQAGYRAA